MTQDRYRRLNSDEPLSWEEEALFLGREIILDQNNHVKMKGWLDSCLLHGGPCAGELAEAEEFCQIIEQSYFGVVDVIDMYLKPLPIKGLYNSNGDFVGRTHEDYIALSYVWGKGKHYQTTLDNIALHKRQNGLSLNYQDMPRAIRDSFDLVRRLFKRYIWIDSLCIIQDSKRSFKLNSHVMDSIYGNAILTICAADGEDTSTGLKALRLEEYPPSQIIETCAPGVRLMVNYPAETGIKASVWNKRAWTFQERLLSKRCLIFTQGRVFFQCRSTTMSEDIVAEPEGAGWSLDQVDAPNRLLLELEKRPIWVYMKSISLYSDRILSRPYNVLDAFNGLANMICATMEAPFVFGLPTSHLDLALWEPVGAVKRRVLNLNATARDHSRSKDEVTTWDYAVDEFPSWSWCGWMDAKIEYRDSTLEGCFTNVHEWLMDRTWISYFIRDGHGRLRPLWDGKRSNASGQAERRWRGYETSEHIARKTIRAREVEIQEPYDDIGSHIRRSDTIEYRRAGPPCDDYGRILSKSNFERLRKNFFETLPESPYRVVMTDYTTKPGKEFPDQPILQFYTWSTFLRVVISDKPKENVGDGMSRYDIEDVIGDWCGSIIIDDEWINRQNYASQEGCKDSKHEFIAISEAKAFTQDECETWTYYVSKDRDQSEWDLFYVLLVEPTGISGHARQRVALGKVFKRGFDNRFSVQEWKEIILR